MNGSEGFLGGLGGISGVQVSFVCGGWKFLLLEVEFFRKVVGILMVVSIF